MTDNIQALWDSKVVVMVSTYNRNNILRKSLDSLLDSFDKIKPIVIVYDDGSVDGTLKLLEHYGDKIIIMHDNINRGLRVALTNMLNKAYKHEPDYISYNQDDVLYKKGWLDDCVQCWDIFVKEKNSFGFITGHEAPEHQTEYIIDMGWEKLPVKKTCRATHLFSSTKRWKEFGDMPDLTPGIAAPKPGVGSKVDWWFMGHPRYEESSHSLRTRKEYILVLPGRITHIATNNIDSTWNNRTTEVW
jgi:glycosyltransferase involved in cell wall biosynthesis